MVLEIAFIPLLLILGALFFIFWIIMLVDAATRKFKDGTEKVVWILIILLVGFIGALVYYFAVYRKYKSLKWFWITLLIVVVLVILLFLFIYLLFTPVSVQRG